MIKLDVSFSNAAHCVVGADGKARPILLGGNPVRDFQPGWKLRGACGGFAPWTLLDLVHASGREAYWVLDEQLDHRPDGLQRLDEEQGALLARQAGSVLKLVNAAILCAPAPRLPPELARFDGLNREAIRDIVRIGADRAVGPTRVISLQRETPNPAGYSVPSSPNAIPNPIQLHAVAETLGGNFQDAITQALLEGFLSCPSPVDGLMLKSQDSLVLHEHRIAYRFVDERYGLVFYVSTTHYPFAKSDLFVPANNTAFILHGETGQLATLAASEFLPHVVANATALLTYLGAEGHRAAPGTEGHHAASGAERHRAGVICRGYPNLHIGHQVWNELTALDRLVRTLPPERLPAVIVPAAAQGSEVYAPIDRIFPELAGRIDRGLHNPAALDCYVYQEGYCLFRALDERVTLDLARRIRDASAQEAPLHDDAALAARIEAGNIPCVLFGLRVENRTAIDPGLVVADTIEHLRQRLGRIVIVVDGHNARLHHDPVSLYESFGQGMHEPPIFTELRLVMQLRRRFEGSEVEIVNLCGAGMSRSLFWARRADFFVAFWGAGLAKYRWICNRPGLVLTNGWNLRQRADLDIYHAPRYQEGGAPIRFIDPASITDMPEAQVLFAPINPIPTYSNFRVDHAGLLRELDGMIESYIPDRKLP